MIRDETYKEVLESLHSLVYSSQQVLGEILENEATPGIELVKRQLASMSHKLFVSRDVYLEKSHAKVGVFGLSMRGKSALLNAILGRNLLPTGPVPTTASIVELPESFFVKKIQLQYPGRAESMNFVDTADANKCLRSFTTRGTSAGPPATRATVFCPALRDSQLLKQKLVLVDTPGVAPPFVSESATVETKRALEALEEVHIALLCMTSEALGAEAEIRFLEECLWAHDPLLVITRMDLWNGSDRPAKFILECVNAMDSKDILEVSARVQKRSDEKELEVLGTGISSLERRILERLTDLYPGKLVSQILENLRLFAVQYEDYGFLPEFSTRGRFVESVMSLEHNSSSRGGIEELLHQFPPSWFNGFLT